MSLLLALGASTTVGATMRMKMPWRGDTFPTSHTYMALTGGHTGCTFGSENCPFDIGAFRWDTTLNAWSKSKVVGEADWTSYTNDLLYDRPLYSPVDGHIISCWRRMPEPAMSDQYDCPGANCMKAGNHVTILTTTTTGDKIVFVGHLKTDSIPESLCPITDQLIYTNPGVCPANSSYDQLMEATKVDPPIPVRKGQFIGNMGMSGNTGTQNNRNPHLHMHAKPYLAIPGDEGCVGPHEEILFDESWTTAKGNGPPAPADWARHAGTAPAFDGTTFRLVWPEPLGIRTDTLEIEEGERPSLVVTGTPTVGGAVAYRDSLDNLTVAAFSAQSDSLTIGGDAGAGFVSRISLAKIGTPLRHVVAAVQNASNKLQVIPFHINPVPSPTRGTVDYTSTDSITAVEATHGPTHTGVVTATANVYTDELKVQAFGATVVGTNDLQIDARGQDTATASVEDLDIATIVAGRAVGSTGAVFKGVVTIEERTGGAAWLRTWQVSSTGATVSEAASIQLHNGTANLVVDDVDVTVVGDTLSREFVVASVRDSGGNLWVLSYQVTSTGALSKLSQWKAGAIEALSTAPAGSRDVVVAVRTTGDLSHLSFSVNDNGVIGRSGTRDGEALYTASGAGLATGGMPDQGLVVTTFIDTNQDVNLHLFKTNYSSVL